MAATMSAPWATKGTEFSSVMPPITTTGSGNFSLGLRHNLGGRGHRVFLDARWIETTEGDVTGTGAVRLACQIHAAVTGCTDDFIRPDSGTHIGNRHVGAADVNAVSIKLETQVEMIVDDERTAIGSCTKPAGHSACSRRKAASAVLWRYCNKACAATQGQLTHFQQLLGIVPVRRYQIQPSHALPFRAAGIVVETIGNTLTGSDRISLCQRFHGNKSAPASSACAMPFEPLARATAAMAEARVQPLPWKLPGKRGQFHETRTIAAGTSSLAHLAIVAVATLDQYITATALHQAFLACDSARRSPVHNAATSGKFGVIRVASANSGAMTCMASSGASASP